mmetsp:Transcript_31437/g.94035  ORF Transcript_31437/g.94035 Transcript_31437/m.94035 type:complete len:264 (-) Transcript_31437:700-1491(-)
MAPPRSFLLIDNPSKGNNLGPIFRCASAFAIDEVVLVGYAKFSAEGSHGSARHVKTTSFPTFKQAVRYLKSNVAEGGCGCESITGILGAGGFYSPEGCGVCEAGDMVSICGEDTKIFTRSKPIYIRPFRGNTCFIVSKRCGGLPTQQARFCDSFIHVPLCPNLMTHPSFEESDDVEFLKSPTFIDVPSCLSIVLHHFTAWASYSERNFEGQKFDVASFRKGAGDAKAAAACKKRAERAEARVATQKDAEEALSAGAFGSLFDG